MSAPKKTANAPAWLLVRERLAALDSLLTAQDIDSLAVAKAFEKVASGLLKAVEASGASSMRFRAVVKALDLKTTKSQLLTFLAEPPPNE